MLHTPAARIAEAFASLYDQGITFEAVRSCCGSCAASSLKTHGTPLVWLWETDKSSANSPRGWYRRPSADAPFVGYLGWSELNPTDMDNVVDALDAAGFDVVRPADSSFSIKVTLHREPEVHKAYVRGVAETLAYLKHELGIDVYDSDLVTQYGIKA